MAVQIVCDGCYALLQPADATSVGSLDPVVYCKACDAAWTATEKGIEAVRVEVIKTFAGERASLLQGARVLLKKLPDDLGG